jgi:hypothetical protein
MDRRQKEIIDLAKNVAEEVGATYLGYDYGKTSHIALKFRRADGQERRYFHSTTANYGSRGIKNARSSMKRLILCDKPGQK